MKNKTLQTPLEVQINDLENHCAEIDSQIKSLQLQKSDLVAQIDQLKQQHQARQTENSAPPSSSPDASKASVTKESTLKEKFDLFASLFSGRSDMHGKRFQSKSSGVSGYSPVCTNEFKWICGKASKKKRIKCVDCDHQSFSPISIEEFTKHLKGENDTGNDVLAAYAIDQDAMCSFVVVDFDAKNAEENQESLKSLHESVTTFMQVSARFEVPTYLERSRSGFGFHIWLFFDMPVSAKDARRLFSALLTIAMDENAQIDFSSYDRLFPHQDTLSESRFGNLIALPLQGRAIKQENTVFVDSDFKRYPDQ